MTMDAADLGLLATHAVAYCGTHAPEDFPAVLRVVVDTAPFLERPRRLDVAHLLSYRLRQGDLDLETTRAMEEAVRLLEWE